jgi:hypothetical protein
MVHKMSITVMTLFLVLYSFEIGISKLILSISLSQVLIKCTFVKWYRKMGKVSSLIELWQLNQFKVECLKYLTSNFDASHQRNLRFYVSNSLQLWRLILGGRLRRKHCRVKWAFGSIYLIMLLKIERRENTAELSGSHHQ